MKEKLTKADKKLALMGLVILVFAALAITGKMGVGEAVAAISGIAASAGVYQHHKQ